MNLVFISLTETFVLARWLEETVLLSGPGMRTEILDMAMCASNSSKFPNIANQLGAVPQVAQPLIVYSHTELAARNKIL